MSMMLDQAGIDPERWCELDRVLESDLCFGKEWDRLGPMSKDILRCALHSMLTHKTPEALATSWLYSMASVLDLELG